MFNCNLCIIFGWYLRVYSMQGKLFKWVAQNYWHNRIKHDRHWNTFSNISFLKSLYVKNIWFLFFLICYLWFSNLINTACNKNGSELIFKLADFNKWTFYNNVGFLKITFKNKTWSYYRLFLSKFSREIF